MEENVSFNCPACLGDTTSLTNIRCYRCEGIMETESEEVLDGESTELLWKY